MTPAVRNKYLGVVLRVGVFAIVAMIGYIIFPIVMQFFGVTMFILAALSTFATAGVANAIALRIYERAILADIGLGWTPASRKNLALGIAGGFVAGAVIVLVPVALRLADFVRVPDEHFQWPTLVFVSVVLLFGAAGEEMLFRGYAFQVLVKAVGPFATILPTAVVFGLAHSANLNFSGLALGNTILWGAVLGYAFLRSGDLWLPIGLHFGWNWALPLLGVNLSGFTMGITGYSIQWKIGALWSGGAYGPEGGLLTSVVIVALWILLWRFPIETQDAFLLRELPQAEVHDA